MDYDRVAQQYSTYRIPDPGISARIHKHTKGARTVLNVGAGMGSYEPVDCEVTAIEPSTNMIAKRKGNKTTLIQGFAENLPFKNNEFDTSMAVLTMHHWSNIELGLREMLRISRKKVVLFTWIENGNDFWLTDYIPEIKEIDKGIFPTIKQLDFILGGVTIETVEIPHNCSDGFMGAYWKRPEKYLVPKVRKAISTFSRIANLEKGLDRLEKDISNGKWHQKYKYLIDKESLDLGYRLVVCEKQGTSQI